jgi:hypothetical protein
MNRKGFVTSPADPDANNNKDNPSPTKGESPVRGLAMLQGGKGTDQSFQRLIKGRPEVFSLLKPNAPLMLQDEDTKTEETTAEPGSRGDAPVTSTLTTSKSYRDVVLQDTPARTEGSAKPKMIDGYPEKTARATISNTSKDAEIESGMNKDDRATSKRLKTPLKAISGSRTHLPVPVDDKCYRTKKDEASCNKAQECRWIIDGNKKGRCLTKPESGLQTSQVFHMDVSDKALPTQRPPLDDESLCYQYKYRKACGKDRRCLWSTDPATNKKECHLKINTQHHPGIQKQKDEKSAARKKAAPTRRPTEFFNIGLDDETDKHSTSGDDDEWHDATSDDEDDWHDVSSKNAHYHVLTEKGIAHTRRSWESDPCYKQHKEKNPCNQDGACHWNDTTNTCRGGNVSVSTPEMFDLGESERQQRENKHRAFVKNRAAKTIQTFARTLKGKGATSTIPHPSISSPQKAPETKGHTVSTERSANTLPTAATLNFDNARHIQNLKERYKSNFPTPRRWDGFRRNTDFDAQMTSWNAAQEDYIQRHKNDFATPASLRS